MDRPLRPGFLGKVKKKKVRFKNEKKKINNKDSQKPMSERSIHFGYRFNTITY